MQGVAVCWGSTVLYLDLGAKQVGPPAASSLWKSAVAILERPQLPKRMHQLQTQLQLLAAHGIQVLSLTSPQPWESTQPLSKFPS